MIFGKKKPSGPVPQEAISRMRASGLSDRDIIKRLKSKGYSYEEIEKSMLSGIRESVEPKTQPMEMRQPPQQQNDIFGGSYQQPAESDIFSQPQEEMPEESAGSEDIVIEELIKGIVEEKWEKTRGDMERMGGEFSRVRAEMKSMEQRLSERREPSHDASAEVRELSAKLEDLDIRISGLERAFRQFLPSLTSNIQSLSEMVHEMKQQKPEYLKPI